MTAQQFTPPPEGETQNSVVLRSFVAYCNMHPKLRFWQALLNWSGVPFILISDTPTLYIQGAVDKTTGHDVSFEDPYNWEGRNE